MIRTMNRTKERIAWILATSTAISVAAYVGRCAAQLKHSHGILLHDHAVLVDEHARCLEPRAFWAPSGNPGGVR